jgi:hypothetical protein
MSDPYSQQYFVAYNPVLSQKFGSTVAALAFDRLEYWAKRPTLKNRPQFHNGFYKFIEPCDHPLYKEGDSFTEELGIARTTFTKAFDKFGIRYKSKTAFLKAQDKFHGKLYVSYHDRELRRTIFIRNEQRIQELYQELKQLQKNYLTTTKQETSEPLKNARSKNESSNRSPYKDKDNKEILSSKKEQNTSLVQNEDAKATTCQMLNIWEVEIGKIEGIHLTPTIALKLYNSFHEVFAADWQKWQLHCRLIASSQFLMGEKPGTHYQIRLLVAITQTFVDQLREGRFELFTRQTPFEKDLKQYHQKLQCIINQEAYVQEQIQKAEKEVERVKKSMITKAYQSLSPHQRETYKRAYEQAIIAKYADENLALEDVWLQPMADMGFEFFIREQLHQELDINDVAIQALRHEIKALEGEGDRLQQAKQAGLLALQEIEQHNADFKAIQKSIGEEKNRGKNDTIYHI